MKTKLKTATREAIEDIFDQLDYKALAAIYCDEGGEEFWKDRRELCQTLGIRVAEVLRNRLRPEGQSLYVGAGVAEIPMLVMETTELRRKVAAFNLRTEEVAVLNAACKALSFQFSAGDAAVARGTFDHLWIVSVLNDPERFPELSALSYGRANPVTFNPTVFMQQRDAVTALADACLKKLTRPALVTVSVEEIPWITDWCERQKMMCVVEEEDYPTAIVEDPICFIRIGDVVRAKRKT
ncbi:MAG: hypothetical protein ACREJU_00925 [Nitrospiraceae bacterium]